MLKDSISYEYLTYSKEPLLYKPSSFVLLVNGPNGSEQVRFGGGQANIVLSKGKSREL